ncbi:MAG TPA: hypothetical protein VNG53_12125 [Bacteroidia bacterium]|nr:hypothetical protein [Bacteroidia bacterium]
MKKTFFSDIRKKVFVTGIIMTLFAASFTPLKAQNDTAPQSKKQKVETMKIAFISQKLDLTTQEAQAFWPVYNNYESDLKILRKNHRQDMRQVKETGVDNMSDKDVEALVDNEIIYHQKELDVEKEYLAKFKAVLPIKKVAKLYAAEEQFKVYLINQLKNRRDGNTHRN